MQAAAFIVQSSKGRDRGGTQLAGALLSSERTGQSHAQALGNLWLKDSKKS
jgi:hypothetical protein